MNSSTSGWVILTRKPVAGSHPQNDMMEEATDEKRIEIHKEAGAIKGRFIYILRKPETGCLAALALPTVAAGRLN